jgi:hypothetical protein
MPTQKRHNRTVKYPGVYFIWGTHRVTGKPEKIFYIDYYNKDGKRVQEKAGSAIRSGDDGREGCNKKRNNCAWPARNCPIRLKKGSAEEAKKGR